MQSKPLRVLGIDPGYGRLGIAVIEGNTLVYSSCFETSQETEHSARLLALRDEVARVIKEFEPTVLSIETLFFTKNQKTAMKVAESRGVVLSEAEKAALNIFELSPLQVKVAVTGYGKSTKDQVTFMVKKLIKIPQENIKKNRKDDEFDAIAIALAGIASYPQYAQRLQN